MLSSLGPVPPSASSSTAWRLVAIIAEVIQLPGPTMSSRYIKAGTDGKPEAGERCQRDLSPTKVLTVNVAHLCLLSNCATSPQNQHATFQIHEVSDQASDFRAVFFRQKSTICLKVPVEPAKLCLTTRTPTAHPSAVCCAQLDPMHAFSSIFIIQHSHGTLKDRHLLCQSLETSALSVELH